MMDSGFVHCPKCRSTWVQGCFKIFPCPKCGNPDLEEYGHAWELDRGGRLVLREGFVLLDALEKSRWHGEYVGEFLVLDKLRAQVGEFPPHFSVEYEMVKLPCVFGPLSPGQLLETLQRHQAAAGQEREEDTDDRP